MLRVWSHLEECEYDEDEEDEDREPDELSYRDSDGSCRTFLQLRIERIQRIVSYFSVVIFFIVNHSAFYKRRR